MKQIGITQLTGQDRSSDPAGQGAGSIGRTLQRIFRKRTHVVQCDTIAGCFRLITLESPHFRDFDWVPGQKIQLGVGAGRASRTYTPMDWNTSKGRTRLLGYMHGSGPASEWLGRVQVGDECYVRGPRASLDPRRSSVPIVVFGDETSVGLIFSLMRQRPLGVVRGFLEVNNLLTCEEVLGRLDISETKLFERRLDGEHLLKIEQDLSEAKHAGATFVLTGKASSVQRLRRTLSDSGVSSARLMCRAYWAPGKTGLD